MAVTIFGALATTHYTSMIARIKDMRVKKATVQFPVRMDQSGLQTYDEQTYNDCILFIGGHEITLSDDKYENRVDGTITGVFTPYKGAEHEYNLLLNVLIRQSTPGMFLESQWSIKFH
jgi:hypothetical protein